MIIGISGKCGSGKDTVASMICGVYPELSIVSFATNVKAVTAIITGTTVSSQFTREGKSTVPKDMPYTCGKYQQIVGAGMRDMIDANVWIRPVLSNRNIVIADVRYKNEADAIKAAGGIIIRVNRADVTSFLNGRDPLHASEVDMDDYKCDHVIENNSTLDSLRQDVAKLLIVL
tara:strand:+ start:31440 stop:31961 length:522 start_codon:yes stop_codon:yes gene_type:complete